MFVDVGFILAVVFPLPAENQGYNCTFHQKNYIVSHVIYCRPQNWTLSCGFTYDDIYDEKCYTHERALIHYYIIGEEGDKIIEISVNFKQIYFNMIFWLQPSREALCNSFLTVFEETKNRDGH